MQVLILPYYVLRVKSCQIPNPHLKIFNHELTLINTNKLKLIIKIREYLYAFVVSIRNKGGVSKHHFTNLFNTKRRNQKNNIKILTRFCYWDLGHLVLFRISCFGFRIYHTSLLLWGNFIISRQGTDKVLKKKDEIKRKLEN